MSIKKNSVFSFLDEKKGFLFFRKAVGPVIATALLLIVAVSSTVVFQDWYKTYSSDLFSNADQTASGFVDLQYLEAQNLYVKSHYSSNLSFSDIIIDGVNCGINGTLKAEDTSMINLGFCTSSLTVGSKEVSILTQKGVFTEVLVLKSILVGNFSVSFSLSSSCPDATFTRVYGLSGLSNAHAELGNQSNFTSSVCIKHNSLTLGTACSGNFVKLFSLADMTNSHVWTDTSAPYGPVSTWYDVCVSSSGGTITSTISSTDPVDGSVCLGSVIEDNLYGGVVGDCNAHTQRIWLNIQ